MSLYLTALVLFAALMHAIWSALAYRFADQAAGFAMLLWATVPMALILIVIAPQPDAATVPYLVASVVLHVAYTGVGARQPDRPVQPAYPISRGLAPVLVALIVLSGWSGIDDELSGCQLVAIAVVLMALTLLATTRIRAQAWRVTPLITAIGIAFAIASYTVVDGIGVRQSGSALGYMGWLSLGLSLGSATVLSVRADVRRRIRAAPQLWRYATFGAILSSGAYWLVIWAQAHGSVAVVATVRETSVVFAVLIGVYVFQEGWGTRRIIAAIAMVIGLMILHAG